MKQWWEHFPTDDQPSQGGIVTKPADPARALEVPIKQQDLRQGEVQIEGGQLGNQKTRYEVDAKPKYDRFGALDKLTDNVRNDPRIKTYENALPIWASALNSPDTAEADSLLVNAIAKVGDPMTGVQQREGDAYQSAASTLEQVKARMLKEFGSDGAGNFTTEGRRRIKEAMTNRMQALATGYNSARGEWRERIKASGIPDIDPETILGKHYGGDFQQYEANYKGAPIRNLDGSQGAVPAGWDLKQHGGRTTFMPGSTPPLSVDITDDRMPGETEEQYQARSRQAQDPGARTPDISDIRTGRGLMEKTDAFVRGLADIPTLGMADEIAAAGNTIFGGGTMGDNLARERGIDAYDTENHFPSRFAGQVGGGFLLPMGAMNSIPQIALKSGAVGAGYGFGSTEGSLLDRTGGAAVGGAGGAAVGAGLGAAIPTLTRGAVATGRRIVGPSNARQQGLLNAATEEQVPINMADLYPGAQNTVATLETIPGASGVVRGGIEAGRDAIEGRVGNLARGGMAREDMGQVVQDAGRRTVTRMDAQADRLYTRARTLAADTPVTPQSVMQTLAGLVRQEEAVPGGTRAGAVIRQYAQAFENGGPITIDGARAMRSELLARLRDDGGLSRQRATNITNQIMRGVSDDIERSLGQAGRGAAVQAYRQADRFYAQSRDEIEQVIERFIGTDDKPKSVEQTIALMQSAAGPKGNAAGLSRMLARLSPEERRDYAATLVEPLGRRSADEPFSPSTFITNIRAISPAARRVIFGADGERSIQNLVRLSNAKKETVNRLNNSRSGQVSNYRTVMSTLITGLPGGGAVAGLAFSAPGTGAALATSVGVAGLAASRGLARAMMNEPFTRLLAQTPATVNPAAINNHLGRLRRLAVQNPEIRGVVEGLEQRVLQAMNDNMRAPGSVAASPDEGREDQQRR